MEQHPGYGWLSIWAAKLWKVMYGQGLLKHLDPLQYRNEQNIKSLPFSRKSTGHSNGVCNLGDQLLFETLNGHQPHVWSSCKILLWCSTTLLLLLVELHSLLLKRLVQFKEIAPDPTSIKASLLTRRQISLLQSNGMGKVLQATRGKSWQGLPAWVYAVPGSYQRTSQWAGTEQLLPQQRSAGMFLFLGI